jgi:sporulation protein YlmC with PRC-barrel domain
MHGGNQVLGSSLPIRTAILGLGLLTTATVQAQSTVTGTGEKKTVTGSTAGPVNPTLDGPLEPTRPSGIVPMRDLLNYRVMAENGEFGRVSDIVLDRNGRMQYLLVTRQGQTYPMPFMSTAFSNTPNTLTYNVPIATLEQLAIQNNQLPTLTNQQFVDRMRQVFGPSFAATVTPSRTNYPATGVGVEGRATGRVGTSPTMTRDPNRPPGTRPTGGSLNVGGAGTGVGGTGVGGPGTSGSGTGRSGTGEARTGTGITGTGAGTSAAGKLQGAAAGGAPGSTGGTSGSAGGAPDRSTTGGNPKAKETPPPPPKSESGGTGS